MDDGLYCVAMTLFCTIPLQGMGKRGVTAPGSHVPWPKWTAVIAFLLLLVLQCRKGYTLGIVMVLLNLLVRLYELQRELISSRSARDFKSIPL